MKNILFTLIFFCLCFSSSFSQKLKTNAEVEYQIFNNTGLPNTLFATLSIDGSTSIYFEKYSTKTFDQDEGAIIRRPKNVFEPYTKYDHAKKEILLFDIIKSNIFFVEDSYNELKWNISNESKEISGYSCIKATTSFRGREWVAWFTPEIPMPYGPWKLHGLPGLIIETYDSTKTYTMRATKIEFKRSNVFDKDFKKMYEAKNEKPISYREFVESYQEYRDNTGAQTRKERKNTTPIPAPKRNGIELIFEWEK